MISRRTLLKSILSLPLVGPKLLAIAELDSVASLSSRDLRRESNLYAIHTQRVYVSRYIEMHEVGYMKPYFRLPLIEG